MGEDIIGVSACWHENETCHLGRLAIDKRFRGLGLRRKLTLSPIEEVFRTDIDQIYLEARDITLKILQKVGGEVVGATEVFYGGNVTPVILNKTEYIKM